MDVSRTTEIMVFVTPIGWHCTCGEGYVIRLKTLNTLPDGPWMRRNAERHLVRMHHTHPRTTIVDYRVDEQYTVDPAEEKWA